MPNEAVAIAESARHLAPEERESFLSSTCADNDALLEEVRALLAADQTMDVGSDATVVDSGNRERCPMPEKIGQFHIRRQIGVGGMGAVYEALQENPRRRVAIKVLKGCMSSDAARKRFEYESQVLARLKHPGIAEIYEAGTYDDGFGPMPYFAMEYISGRREIDAYIEQKQLDRSARLRLFTQVCEALHHGHQKGVIHRDLKPGNILVDLEGRPRLIDFGIARATDSDVALATMQTEVGQIIGTIEYMSPEQCEGEPDLIDVRSDVYSLGVILFEFLTGERPRKLSGTSLYEAVKVIKESTPTKMGTIDRSLRGDLETIVGKAMEKNPDRRYQSALELKQDIDRFLAREPIEARPASIVYQTRMFTKRHKAVTASIIIVAIVLVVATSWSLVERGRATDALAQAQRDRDASINSQVAMAAALEQATIETARTERVKVFMSGVFGLADPANAQGRQLTVPEMIQEAASQIPDVFGDEPAMAAELYQTLGAIQIEFGDFNRAEGNLMKALVLGEREHGTSSEEAMHAGTLLAAAMVEQGRYDEAESRLKAIIETTAMVEEDVRGVNLLARKWLLEILGTQLRMEEAAVLSETLVSDAREYYGADHNKAIYHEVSLAQYQFATMRLSGQPIPADFERPYGSLERVTRLLGVLHPVTLKARLAESMLDLNELGGTASDPEAAREDLDKLVEDCRRVLGNAHVRTLEAIYIQGVIRIIAGDLEASATLFRESYDGFVTNHGEHHPMAHQVATMLGTSLLNLGRLEEAAPVLKASWRGLQKLWGDTDIRSLSAEGSYVVALLQLGRFEEAASIYESTLAHHDFFSEVMMGESKLRIMLSKMAAELDFDRVDEAMATAHDVLMVAQGLDTLTARARYAYPLQAVVEFQEHDRIEEATELARDVFPFVAEMLGDDPNMHLQMRLTVARSFLHAEAPLAAMSVLREVKKIAAEDGVRPGLAGRALVFLGLATARTGHAEEAIDLFGSGLQMVVGEPSDPEARAALIEAMTRGERADVRQRLKAAAEATDDPAHKGVYSGLIAEFPEHE